MITNYIPSKAIIGKIYKDLKPSSPDFEADAMDWIGEALEFIGYTGPGMPKTIELQVKNNRAPLPGSLREVRSVWYEGSKLSLGGNLQKRGFDSNTDVYISKPDAVLDPSINNVTRYGYSKPGVSASDAYYLLAAGYVLTSFESGTIQLKYVSSPVDEEGYPIVPDSPYFKQALFWYVLRQMEMGGFNHPQFNFAYCDQQWKHYCIAAGNDAMMPSPAMMKRFGSSWVSFFIDNMSEEDEFSDLDMDTAPDTQ